MSEEINKIDSCLYPIVLFMARKNRGSLKIKKLVDQNSIRYYSDIRQYPKLKTVVLF